MLELNKARPANLKIDPKWKIGVVTARFNFDVTSKLQEGCARELKKLGVNDEAIMWVQVPGAYEIPLAAKQMMDVGIDAVIALGAVIRGETTHYDHVCSAVDRGVMQVMLEYGRPVVFGVLTTENLQQAVDRVGGKAGHKGEEAALVAIEMLNLKNTFLTHRSNL